MVHLSCVYPAHVSPSSSPSYSPFKYYFVIAGILLSQPFFFFFFFLNRSCYIEAAQCSIVRGQSKNGGQGGRAPWWGSGGKAH